MRPTPAPIRRAVENLEPRRLLHGEFDVTFNFQPEGSPLAPNAVPDYGYTYGDRGNGYAYGWNIDSRGIMRDRNKTPDQRLDTVAQLQQNGESHVWELEIPNGQYEVTLFAGDSKYLDGQHHIDAEGTRVMYGVQSTRKQYLKATKIIDVQDGRLTISPESSGVNSKLISVDVKSFHPAGEALPIVSIATITNVAEEGVSNGVVRVSRSADDISADLVVGLDWSGSAGKKDIKARPASVTIPAGSAFVDISIIPIDDALDEALETAAITIRPAGNYQATDKVFTTVTIKGDEAVVGPEPTKPTVTVIASDDSAGEDGDEGEYQLTRDQTSGSLTVTWTWSSLATSADYQIGRVTNNGTTFTARPNTITFANGESEIRLRLRAIDDTAVEGNEHATLNLATSSAYVIGSGFASASILIRDNDPAPTTKSNVTIAATDSEATEGGGTAAITLTRTGGTQTGTLVVPLTWSGSAGSADLNRPSSVTFAAGASTATIILTATDDALVESDETATATIAADAAYTVGSPAAASVTIHDNDTVAPGTFTNINWSTTSSPPVVFSETTSATIDNKLYLFGGFNGVFSPQKNVYRFDGTTWTRMNDSPVAFTHVGSTEVDGKVWFAGGYLGNGSGGQIFGTTNVRIYDPSNDTWANGPSLPSARAAGSMVKVDRKLYYFGGEVANRTSDSTTMWALDLDNQSAGWVAKASMPMARNHVPAVASNGKIIVLGGQTGYDGNLVARDDIQLYDVASNTWTVSSKKLPGARSHTVSATLLYQGKIIMVGGESAHDVPQKNVWAIDPSTLVTTALNNFPTERFSAAMGIVNGKLYVIGGYRGGIATQGYVGTFV
jgi:N-acetylneuraminic acid mutarotase